MLFQTPASLLLCPSCREGHDLCGHMLLLEKIEYAFKTHVNIHVKVVCKLQWMMHLELLSNT